MTNGASQFITENREALEALAESDLRTSELAQSSLDHFDLSEPEEPITASPSSEEPSSTNEPEPIRSVLDF